ncbi:hypothetical protein JCM18899A_48460 [Nocardioides sp. AN3]
MLRTVGDELPRDIVYGRDVVDVERVTQPEGVGQHPDANSQDRVAASQVVMVRRDQQEQGDETQHVQHDDEYRHARQRSPVDQAQALPERAYPRLCWFFDLE